MVPVLIILALILLNGLFVAAEFAIVGVPRAAIDRRAARGSRSASRVRHILRNPRQQDRYIATAQLGITCASLGLGMYGEHVLAAWLADLFAGLGPLRWLTAHSFASIFAVAFLTYFHIVLGEMVPKSLALQYAEETARRITPVMLLIQALCYPLVAGLNGLGNGLLRLFGINRQAASGEHYHTAEELQYIIQESQEGGLLQSESARVLRELFAFSDLTAGEVMVPRVRMRGIPLQVTRAELTDILRASPHTRYPVYDGDLDHIQGMIHVKDLLQRLVDNRALEPGDLQPVSYLPETATLDIVLQAMHRDQTQMVVVMDEHGGTAGLITVEDLFEEVVGEIEEDVTLRPDVYRDVEGRLHVTGTVRIEEVGEHLHQTLEHEEVDTVSGLVLALLNRPPAVGDSVVYEQARFEVAAVEGHGVRECIVTPVGLNDAQQAEHEERKAENETGDGAP